MLDRQLDAIITVDRKAVRAQGLQLCSPATTQHGLNSTQLNSTHLNSTQLKHGLSWRGERALRWQMQFQQDEFDAMSNAEMRLVMQKSIMTIEEQVGK